MPQQVLSIIDYAAWEKGYMPPSEHILIDELSYRGARVVMSSDMGGLAYWLVVRGDKICGRQLLAVKRAIEDAIETLENTPNSEQHGGEVKPLAGTI